MRLLSHGWAGLCTLLAAPLLWGSEGTPFIYQGTGTNLQGETSLEWETGVGTREARPLGDRGVEQDLRLIFGITDFLSAEMGAGLLFEPGSDVRTGYYIEALFQVLREENAGVNLGVSAGFAHDYRDASIPRLRLTLDKAIGRFRLAVAGLLEFPQTGNRDPVDLIFSLAGSCAVGESLQIGIEAAGEDLEGFWEENESEGGARFLAGPTVWWMPLKGFTLKLNLGGVVLLARAPGGSLTPEGGFQGRLVLGYHF